ncbi:MAG: hypothetical protein QF864_02185, partial [SAR202 cluster bacterium]|nr:hypothetical protein [SAR202 cluster bacterium]
LRDFKGGSYNFGPSDSEIKTVSDVVKAIESYLPDSSLKLKKAKSNINEHHYLKLNCDKALNMLNWSSTLTFAETIKLTIEWYLHYYSNPSKIYSTTLKQIKYYITLSSERNISYNFKGKK